MPWPPTSNQAFLTSGVPLVKFGTDGMFGSYILKSVKVTDRVDRVVVENGTGLESWRALIVQGRDVEITAVDDSGITPPKVNTVISIVDQFSGTTNYRVTSKDGQAVKKQDAEIIIRAEFLTNIEGGGNVISNQTSVSG